ncbi:hypothetical protein LTS15_001848 [Exophiala xenobiotica]|nr:hypothetical protein LTS15_001848 [Exophiala xenobiotica]
MPPPPQPPRSRDDFKVAVICALPLEAACILATFDQEWEDGYRKAPGDTNAYSFGNISGHNVVVVHMPEMGKASAAGAAAHVRSSFANLKYAFVVGICGGVPHRPGKPEEEIILGDVVIGQALAEYDFGRQYPDAFEIRKTSTLSREMGSILARLRTPQKLEQMEHSIEAQLHMLQEKLPHITSPGRDADHLYEQSYLHKHQNNAAGASCLVCQGRPDKICSNAHILECGLLGCKTSKLIPRQRLPANASLSASPTSYPRLHLGKIGSGDTVMKSGVHRDEIAEK